MPNLRKSKQGQKTDGDTILYNHNSLPINKKYIGLCRLCRSFFCYQAIFAYHYETVALSITYYFMNILIFSVSQEVFVLPCEFPTKSTTMLLNPKYCTDTV